MMLWRRIGLCALATVLAMSAPLSAQTAPPGAAPSSRVTTTGTSARPGDGDDRIVERGPTGGTLFDVAESGGWPEFILSGPPADVQRIGPSLVSAGAELLRIRDLPGLNRELRIYRLRGLNPDAAQQIVDANAAAGVTFDVNAIYRYAQASTPRLYAPDLIGAAPGCRLPDRVLVGVIDGPVLADHPALTGARVSTRSTLLPSDRSVAADHGTAVAALIAGEGGAFAGFAPGVHVVAVSSFAREGSDPGADVDRIAGALDVLARSGADVINMSFAGPQNDVLSDLLTATAFRGAILVAAAGNTGAAEALLPSSSPDVLAVTAIDAALRPYRQASSGAHIDFAAPGVDLFVAGAGGGRYASGTSFAAPIVAALAARLHNRGVRSIDGIRSALRNNSRDLGAPGRDTQTGWGLVTATGC